MKSLNIGCGAEIRRETQDLMDKIGGEWVLGDKFYTSLPGVEEMDAMDIPYPENTFNAIVAEHLIEHFHREEVTVMLNEWFRVLKPGGFLYIETPDMQATMDEYIHNDDYCSPRHNRLNDIIWGSSLSLGQVHKTGFVQGLLATYLHNASFIQIQVEKLHNIHNNAILRAIAQKP